MSEASFGFPAIVNSCFDFRTFRSMLLELRSDMPGFTCKLKGEVTCKLKG